ncbi:hypothetical protein E2C01_097633 [Portunus trituberculatus]|uniref:Uncharacterized protein n=1 Tax=Portunus trituberculatus TaxID=210409 RepID=A0A5B7K674_PORTR|nr:hypothetical protein [Portunus trituberculatus]
MNLNPNKIPGEKSLFDPLHVKAVMKQPHPSLPFEISTAAAAFYTFPASLSPSQTPDGAPPQRGSPSPAMTYGIDSVNRVPGAESGRSFKR